MCNADQRGLWDLKVFKTVSAAIALMAACVAQANATETVYTVEANFLNDATVESIPLDLEGFNVDVDASLTLVFGDITVTSPVFNIDTSTGGFGILPTEGTHFIFGQSVTFTFLTPINAFGIDVLDFGDSGGPTGCIFESNFCTLSISLDGGTPTVLFDTRDGDGGDGSVLFGGVINTNSAFTSVTFSHSGGNDGVGFDRLQFGCAPGPSVGVGMVLHLRFDDGCDPTTDISGNGNHGDLIGDTFFVIQDLGGTSNDIAPIFGNQDAMDFLGDGDDYVEVSDDPVLDLSGSFTVAAWVNVDDNTQGAPVVSKDFASNGESNYNLQVTGTRVQLFFTFDAVASPNPPTLGTSLCDPGACGIRSVFDVVSVNTWHLIAGVYNNSTKTIAVYVDGVKEGESSFNTSGSPETNNQTVQIGRRKATQFAGPGMDGTIDDVRIYNRALSGNEIFDLFKSTIRVAVDIIVLLGLPDDPSIPDSIANNFDADVAGEFPVAILSSAEFDATSLTDGVDPNTFVVGSPRLNLLAECDPSTFDDTTDVNGDGLIDVACSAVITQDPDQIAESHTFVQAETVSGFPIEGTDVLRVIGLRELKDTDGDGIPDHDEAKGCKKDPGC